MTDDSNSIEKALGKLLILISDIAMSIRMNSPYNSRSLSNPKTPHAVFVLSDAIHNLHAMGEALIEGNSDKLVRAAQNQRDYWQVSEHLDRLPKA